MGDSLLRRENGSGRDGKDRRGERNLRFGRVVRLFGSLRKAGAGHALAETAFLDERFLQMTNLLVEEIISELDFGFFGNAGGFTAFKDVLLAGAGSLDHLVEGAVAFFQEALTEPHRAVINDASLLKG